MLFLSTADEELLKTALPHQIDGIELRLDLFPKIDLNALKNSKHTLMFTLREASHGGSFSGSEEERQSAILKLLSLNPAFFDLEYDMDPVFLQKTILTHPHTKFILSYHNLQSTPENLQEIYEIMAAIPAYGYKIAALSRSSNDALRMLLLSKKHPKLSSICMGDLGEFARVIGKVVGNLIDYCTVTPEKKTAPGQLTLNELLSLYDYSRLSSKTALYGLIGDPITKSQGHVYHNEVFKRKKRDAVYVKTNVKKEELALFISLAKEIGFSGLSVTMPLKETILPFLDQVDPKAQKIGAVNTLLFTAKQIFGSNTDADGALDAIEKRAPVKNKKIVIIGTGGTAKAIAFEALSRGAQVFILSRDKTRAEDLSKILRCEGGSFLDIFSTFDILVNCAPNFTSLEQFNLSSSTLVMDVNYNPKNTPLLIRALELGCSVIYGEEMFFNQAAAQTKVWM